MRQHDNRYTHYVDPVTQTASGAPISWDGEDICPSHSPVTGRPLQIERIDIIVEVTGSVATALVAGADVWRCLRNLTLVQRDKVHRYRLMHGPQLRAIAVACAGVERVEEHADWAIGALAAKRAVFPLYMTTPKAYAGRDTACMSAALEKLSFTGVETGANGPCGVGGGTLTFTSASWKLRVICREVPYMLNGPAITWEALDFVSGETVKKVRAGAKAPAALFLHKDGAVGGATLASLTNVWIDEYGSQQVTTPTDLREIYATDREVARGWGATAGATTVLDPFVLTGAGGILPVMFPGSDGRSRPSINRPTLTLHAIPALAGLQVLAGTMAPRNDALATYLGATYAPKGEYSGEGPAPVGTHNGWRLKTEGRTQRKMSGRGAQFLPKKATIHQFTSAE